MLRTDFTQKELERIAADEKFDSDLKFDESELIEPIKTSPIISIITGGKTYLGEERSCSISKTCGSGPE